MKIKNVNQNLWDTFAFEVSIRIRGSAYYTTRVVMVDCEDFLTDGMIYADYKYTIIQKMVGNRIRVKLTDSFYICDNVKSLLKTDFYTKLK